MKEMQWDKLLSAKRLGGIQRKEENSFERDIDRITFSSSFRRLSKKTQVHPLASNDHVHTRLTHSLEVARVGRALGNELGRRIKDELPNDFEYRDLGTIVEAACLAHDLGNPPFGHAGENSIKHWFDSFDSQSFKSLSVDHKRDLTKFEGNAQGFRMLTTTENNLFKGGLRLTAATLGAFLKYPWTSTTGKKKFSSYMSEQNILNQLGEELGLISKGDSVWARHPLAYLVEAADDICYGIIDLEDAVELGILNFEQVKNLCFEYLHEDDAKEIGKKFVSKNAFRVNLSKIRGPIFRLLVSGAVDGFSNGYERIMRGDECVGVYDLLGKDSNQYKLISAAKDLSEKSVFSDPKKVEIELGSYSIMETLLESFSDAAYEISNLLGNNEPETEVAWKSKLVLKLLGDHAPSSDNTPPGEKWTYYQCMRRVMDFVSGMTDNYATYVAKQIKGMGFSGTQRP